MGPCGSFGGRLSKLEERPLQTALQKGVWEQADGGFKVSGGLMCLVHSGLWEAKLSKRCSGSSSSNWEDAQAKVDWCLANWWTTGPCPRRGMASPRTIDFLGWKRWLQYGGWSMQHEAWQVWPPVIGISPWDFLGKNTGVGCYFILQGTLLTQGSNLVSCTMGRFFTDWTTREALDCL